MDTINLVLKWWKTWHTLPVLPWVKAASFYRQGQFKNAMALYLKGLEKYNNHPARNCARLDLAYCMFKLGDLDAAELELKNIVRDIPSSREGHARLAKLQVWRGQSLEGAWTVRRALRHVPLDPTLACLFLYASIDARAPHYLIQEALRAAEAASPDDESDVKLSAGRARAIMVLRRPGTTEFQEARTRLAQLASTTAPVEVLMLFAEVLLEEGKIAHARRLLRRSLQGAADYPRLLSLLAETYLKSGPFYNADYARQLATTACQNTNWSSAREMHILAESYYHVGDKISALVIASKAKEMGAKLLGTYRYAKNLDQLIENLSTGTQA